MSLNSDIKSWFVKKNIRPMRRDGVTEYYGYITLFESYTYILQVVMDGDPIVKCYLIEDPLDADWEVERTCESISVAKCLDLAFESISVDAELRARRRTAGYK